MLKFLGVIATLAAIIGYVLNFFKVLGHTGDWGIEIVLRLVGVFVPFLGAFIGFIN